MIKRKVLKKIVWSVDPFESSPKLLQKDISYLKQLCKGNDECKIIPVYAVVPNKVDTVGFALNLMWLSHYKRYALQSMKTLIDKIKLDNIHTPKVLDNSQGNISGAVKAIFDYAEKTRADIVVVSSHSRTGVERLFLGSFAETMLIHAKLPVFIFSRNTKTRAPLKQVLFPTNFSATEEKVFKEFVKTTWTKNAKITLFHQVLDPIEPVVSSPSIYFGGAYSTSTSYLEEVKNTKEALAKKWCAWAKKQDCQVDYLVLPPAGMGIVDGIISAAKKLKKGLIFMPTETGPVLAALTGSLTRQTARMSDIPLLVIQTKTVKKKSATSSKKL